MPVELGAQQVITRIASVFAGVACAATAGCAAQSPYKAYLACNEQIKTAKNDREMFACFTKEKRETILAEHAGDTPDIWREQFRNWRPANVKLFREMIADDGDNADLYMYSGVNVYLARHTAKMEKVRNVWKITDENTLGMSPGFNDDLRAPAAVELSFTGAIEWESKDALTVGAPRRPRCHLQIRHIYDYTIVQMQADCDKLQSPGDYSAADIQHPQAQRPILIQAPEGGGLDEVTSGTFTVESISGGRFTASFAFSADGVKGPYTVRGRFENIPITGEAENE
ncbi:hypothetical protein [Hyphococcus sp.]|uniref:hypothetical protein n=1 Tax=Hyphococcus sp. TaxID=2038636 RepID=UPI003CCBEC21